MPFPTRKLGPNGPEVTAIGSGLMGLSLLYGAPPPDEERFAFLDHIYATGQHFWDTADVYGDNEDLIGRWFKRNPGAREKIFLATKFASTPDWQIRTDPEYVRQACARSLARLGVDYIDLYYAHRVDLKTPIEETMEALVELKNQGKIKYIGLCEVSVATLRRACAVHHVTAVQVEYNPFALDIENAPVNLLPACKELGVAVVAYAPLGRGMLASASQNKAALSDNLSADDFRRTVPRFSAENLAKNLERVDQTLGALAREKSQHGQPCTVAQLTLAWVLRQWEHIVPIPGTKRIAYYDQNMAALAVQLTDAENTQLRQAFEAVNAAGVGARYADDSMAFTYADTPLPAKK
ncbi:aldo-keto reductase [Niveomyces insectorum RCEF 264]|uniref:Aldo-keto reductase n=1 Tax=Niveomyces insectorum RCEF 264 TaxID=1081102 RepID=A0A167P5L0_9HYPO|nr:aldo-keto reductase [Niveomyces insectorum RCEF 264]